LRRVAKGLRYVGYRHPSHFVSVFRRHHGMTPGAARQ